jgi:hypothetical protein
MPKKKLPKPKFVPWPPQQVAKLNNMDGILRATCPDPHRLAEIYHMSICELFPEYAEMHEEALNSLSIDSLPLFLHLPRFCLKVFEKRLKESTDSIKEV